MRTQQGGCPYLAARSCDRPPHANFGKPAHFGRALSGVSPRDDRSRRRTARGWRPQELATNRLSRSQFLRASVEGRRFRILAVLIIAAVLAAGGLWLVASPQTGGVEFLVQDVAILANRPDPGQSELHVYLIARNRMSFVVHLEKLVLVASDPDSSTLFTVFVEDDVVLPVRHTMAFSEVAVLDGLWSESAFLVRIFFGAYQKWESRLNPDQPAIWRGA